MSNGPAGSRYLTKSRFKTAFECPRKLYYLDRSEYGNASHEDEFLRMLAEGGFQVGALAKLYYPDGIDLEGLGTQAAIARTDELLTRSHVTLFEAALQVGPYLVRVDVLKKEGARVELLEVKAKSVSGETTERGFFKRGGGLDSGWKPYLVDIAFQTWVARQRLPMAEVHPFLLLADKDSVASVDGLHQLFLIRQVEGRAQVETPAGLDPSRLGDRILRAVAVEKEVEYLLQEEVYPGGEILPAYAARLAEMMEQGTRPPVQLGEICKRCEFRIGPELRARDKKSGFEECWVGEGRIRPEDLGRPLVFEIWNCRKTEDLLSRGKLFMDELAEDDLKSGGRSNSKRAMSPGERQWLQVSLAREKNPEPYIDRDGIREKFAGLRYPLHCIDFETAMAAIPFHCGRRPYEQLAFQFSHHILHEDGRVEHASQYLHPRPGEFPNFDFLRALRQSLSKDQGSIFRYAPHENTVLRQIRDQLEATPQPDQRDLIAFIDEISHESGEEGATRDMIDLRELVLDYYYHPRMGGSNSIKKVIPAVLGASRGLQAKYGAPVYGRGAPIPSLNFDPIRWIELDSRGEVVDPYKRLPPVFSDVPREVFEGDAPLFSDSSVKDGGAAMTAWARMQFTEMSESERAAIRLALLKYCELDTLAMVWLLEYFNECIGKGIRN